VVLAIRIEVGDNSLDHGLFSHCYMLCNSHCCKHDDGIG